jgi:hypothetical protein
MKLYVIVYTAQLTDTHLYFNGLVYLIVLPTKLASSLSRSQMLHRYLFLVMDFGRDMNVEIIEKESFLTLNYLSKDSQL